MKKIIIYLSAVFVIGCAISHFAVKAADAIRFQTFEYATIRWDGRENTHLIRPNGTTETLGPILNKVKRPDRVDERAFYMNIAMNAVAHEGYEFAGMTPDEIVMKRALAR